MARRVVEVDGESWSVYLSGRTTSYPHDQVSVVFELGTGENSIKRTCRFRPAGRRGMDALAALSNSSLRDMLRSSQPAWTSPELAYGKGSLPV
jgi:hypothetical protein